MVLLLRRPLGLKKMEYLGVLLPFKGGLAHPMNGFLWIADCFASIPPQKLRPFNGLVDKLLLHDLKF